MAKRSQAPGDATVLKQFFCNNFVIFRRRSKRIAFLEAVNFSTCIYVHIFNFCDGHPSSAKYLVTDSFSRLAKGKPSESQFSIGTVGMVWFYRWGKTVSCRLCTG